MPMHNAFSMDRRDCMKRALYIIGASPLLLQTACQSSDHIGSRKLDAAQRSLLNAIIDTVIPKTDTAGAVELGVPQKLDAMLSNWASADRYQSIMDTMTDIDKLGSKPFAMLNPDERTARLVAYDIEGLKKVPKINPKADEDKEDVAKPGWLNLKELIFALYFGSEHVMTKMQGYEHVPGKWQPSIKIPA
jgi:gluconate 2-dehydrogenase gamma chain